MWDVGWRVVLIPVTLAVDLLMPEIGLAMSSASSKPADARDGN